MRVIGLLSWWDESPVWLAAAIGSLARVCDHVVALDGRYELYPDYTNQSPTDQMVAIVEAAKAAGVGLTMHTAPRPYRDEMHKRTKLFELGALEAVSGDWYFVMDADERVIDAPDKDWLHHFLGNVGDDVSTVTVSFDEWLDPHESPERTELSNKLPCDWRVNAITPRFFRAYDKMRVVGYHFNYVGDDNGEPVELWGDDSVVKHRREWETLRRRVIVENRNRQRAKVRDQDREKYYQDRDDLGIETIAPLAELEEGVAA